MFSQFKWRYLGNLLGLILWLSFFSPPVLAESAPVYEADTMSPLDDTAMVEQNQDLPSSPPEQGMRVVRGAFPEGNGGTSDQRLKHLEQRIKDMEGRTANA